MTVPCQKSQRLAEAKIEPGPCFLPLCLAHNLLPEGSSLTCLPSSLVQISPVNYLHTVEETDTPQYQIRGRPWAEVRRRKECGP